MKLCVLSAVAHYFALPAAGRARNFAGATRFAVVSLDSLSDNQRLLLLLGLLLILASIVVFAFWLGIRSTGKHMNAQERMAATMGFSFQRDGAGLLDELSPGLYLLNIGHHRKTSNVMRGNSAAGAVVLFEHDYQIEVRNMPPIYGQTVAAYCFPSASLPQFHLGANHLWNKSSLAPDFEKIAFEDDPAFSRRYILWGRNANAVREFFQPSLLEFFASLPEKPEWTVEAGDQWLLFYYWRKILEPEEWQSFIDAAAQMSADFTARAGMG